MTDRPYSCPESADGVCRNPDHAGYIPDLDPGPADTEPVPWHWDDDVLEYEHADEQICGVRITCPAVREALAAALGAPLPGQHDD